MPNLLGAALRGLALITAAGGITHDTYVEPLVALLHEDDQHTGRIRSDVDVRHEANHMLPLVTALMRVNGADIASYHPTL